MKKKILYLILMLCAVAMPLGVRAEVGTGSSVAFPGEPGGGNPGGAGGDWKDTHTYTVSNSWGVRVSLVESDGDQIGSSINFLNSNFNPYANRVYTFNTATQSKISAIKNGVSLNSNISTSKGGLDFPGYRKDVTESLGTLISLLDTNPNATGRALAEKVAALANSGTSVDVAMLDGYIYQMFGRKFTVDINAKDWYLLIEPIRCITKDDVKDNGKVAYICGTPSEFSKYGISSGYKAPGPLSKYFIHYQATWNYMYIASTGNGNYASFSANGNNSTFTGLTIGNGVTSAYIETQAPQIASLNGNGVGLIWLGKNAKKEDKHTCSSVTIDSSAPIDSKFTYYSVSSISGFASWDGSSKYSGGYYKKDEGYNPNYYINAVCYDAPTSTTCSKEATNASKFPLSNGGLSIATKDNYDSSKYTGYYNSGTGYDKNYYVNSVCYPETTTCSSVITNSAYPPSDGTKTIKIESDYNKGNFIGYYNSDAAYDSRYYVNSTCYTRPACSDFYYNIKDFRNVPLDAAANTNCCKQYESSSGTDLNRLYRDHPECYSCTYSERRIDATCNESNNTGEVGDLLNNGIGNAQTCAYYIASGVNTQNSKPISAAKGVLTRRNDINSYCKVVCTEKVTVKFPLFNHNYIQQGSYIVWPTNLAFKDEASRLVLHGTANCWYYVDSVGLDMLSRSNKSKATEFLNDCASDFKQAYEGTKKVISYDLKGNFSVKYNDSEYGRKNINLVKENYEAANYSHSGSLNMAFINNAANANIGYSRTNLNNFVKAVEGITFEITQSANYVIDSSSGYNYSYNGKWYSTYDEKWGNNTVKLEYAALGLKNDLYKGGKLEIDYSSIGGGSKKYSTTQKTYGTCEYCTVSAPLKECPAGTKNAGMNLTQIMEMESLSHEEAISKYCDASLTVCPSGTYYAGSAVTEACLKDDNCKELTCNLYACTINNECKVLNYCISDQVEKYGKSFDEAKRYCENAYCGPGDNISDSIEYRVIDLRNPFPGVSAKFGVSIFNTNVAGRKPGQNWNSLNLVKKEILNNRGVSGDKVYSLEPLFEFNLTPSVIQRIRNYNDKNSYDDFTLKCKQNDKYACVASGFNIRSEDYGNVRTLAACQNISNLTNFNSCYNS